MVADTGKPRPQDTEAGSLAQVQSQSQVHDEFQDHRARPYLKTTLQPSKTELGEPPSVSLGQHIKPIVLGQSGLCETVSK
jgi:CHASE2 domain-containing sensor protein